MKRSRRSFLKYSGESILGLAGAGSLLSHSELLALGNNNEIKNTPINSKEMTKQSEMSIIGIYGQWANSLYGNKIPRYSFRNEEWTDVADWQPKARQFLLDCMAVPDIGREIPETTVSQTHEFDGLHIEELSWQLSYGRVSKGLVLKPAKTKGRLPAILAFHDHGLQKYYGYQKLTQTSKNKGTIITEHQNVFYEGRAWANEIAKRGYVVFVPDVFPFGSRRMWIENVPEDIRHVWLGLTKDDIPEAIRGIWPGLNFNHPGSDEYIKNYNLWAAEEEHVIAKSLFSAGTTWPGVFFGEDKKSLDILCAREDVDPERVGCAGLSGGGCRTNFMAGLDSRIKCAASIGFMTTWKDLILNKSYTHTWMGFVPRLTPGLGYPEILGIRAPLPTFVLNNSSDPLFTLSEQRRADEILRDVYKKAGEDEKYKCTFYPGGHKFDIKMQNDAFDWFDRWLKK